MERKELDTVDYEVNDAEANKEISRQKPASRSYSGGRLDVSFYATVAWDPVLIRMAEIY